jgi:hypothetical protein
MEEKNMKNKWECLKEINEVLKSDFLCVPPYQRVNFDTINKLYQLIAAPDKMILIINEMVNNPGQRAYQVEYRYKKCDIFMPYITVMEYAIYDVLNGNWVCAYLSLLPVVEAVLRKWADVEPHLTFEGMKKFALQISDHMDLYNDERKVWSDSHINYLQDSLIVLFERFDKYKEQSFNSIFNRNLTLHKLEGVIGIKEGFHNVTRILLVLDVIAEIYLMQDFDNYWRLIFYANLESNYDYQLRYALYKKWTTFSIGPNDILLIQNALLKSCDEIDKIRLAESIDQKTKKQQENEKSRLSPNNDINGFVD